MSAKPSLKALYELLKQVPSHDDVIDMLGQLKSEDEHASDRAAAIVGAVLIEHGLKVIILSDFVKLSKDDTERLFDPEKRGPLGTFSDRIRMSYAMGLLGQKARRDLVLVQNIRNLFAHSGLKICFKLTAISDLCDQFVLIDKDDTRSAKDAYIETIGYISGAFQKKITKDVTSFLPGFGMITHPHPSRRFLP